MKAPKTYDDGLNEGFAALQKALKTIDKLTAELAQARKREVKVRWEWNDAYVRSIHIGNIRKGESGMFDLVAAILGTDRDVYGRAPDESSARSAVEAHALKAICGEESE